MQQLSTPDGDCPLLQLCGRFAGQEASRRSSEVGAAKAGPEARRAARTTLASMVLDGDERPAPCALCKMYFESRRARAVSRNVGLQLATTRSWRRQPIAAYRKATSALATRGNPFRTLRTMLSRQEGTLSRVRQSVRGPVSGILPNGKTAGGGTGAIGAMSLAMHHRGYLSVQ